VWFPARHSVLTLSLLVPAAAFVWYESSISTAQPDARPVHAADKPGRKPPPKNPGDAPASVPQPNIPPSQPGVSPNSLTAPKPLANPPDPIRAVYFTGWSAGLESRVGYLIDLHKTTTVNAVVIDVKDYSGYVAYRTGVAGAKKYGAVRVMIRDLDALVDRLHREGIYVIARITCFQDPVLAAARPDLAVHRVSKLPRDRSGPLTKDSLWLDRKGLAWLDPASHPAWEYLAAIAKGALSHGVDEVNFDYVRFPSDGNLKDMYFPNWDGKTPKHIVIRSFFRYLRHELPEARISVDLFGLATVNGDDLGIGQVIEDAYASFDYVCPMVYPSHFARQFLGFPNPAAHPYEVVNYSIKEAGERLDAFNKPPAPDPKGGASADPAAAPKIKAARLRPWLQDFNLGAKYDAPAVRAEIKAVQDALGAKFAGWMMWSPSNVYTRQALTGPPTPPAARPPEARQAVSEPRP
jgi:hypothetical protein